MAGELEIEPIASAPAVEAPVVAAPEAAPAPAVEAPKHPVEIPTLLESFKAPKEPGPAEKAAPEVKPVQTKPVEKVVEEKVEAKPEDKPAEVKPSEPETPNPIDFNSYKFEFAEHVKPQAEKVKAFTEFALENKLSPEAAQKAVSYFNEAASAFVAEQQRQQIQAWNETRSGWRTSALADPMIGGAGHQHAMGVIARTRDMLISDAQPGTKQYDADAKEVEDFLRITGAGDHPAFLRMLYRAGHRLDEPRMVTARPEPTKTNGIRPSNSLYAPPRGRA
jgi:hypothetical protein